MSYLRAPFVAAIIEKTTPLDSLNDQNHETINSFIDTIFHGLQSLDRELKLKAGFCFAFFMEDFFNRLNFVIFVILQLSETLSGDDVGLS